MKNSCRVRWLYYGCQHVCVCIVHVFSEAPGHTRAHSGLWRPLCGYTLAAEVVSHAAARWAQAPVENDSLTSTKLWRWRRLLTWGNVTIHGQPSVAMNHISCCCCAIVFQTGSSGLAFSYFRFLFQGKLVCVRLVHLASGSLYFLFFMWIISSLIH